MIKRGFFGKLAPALKDKGILVGWIAGLVLIASLVWSLSFPFRAMRLMHSTNRVLALMGDARVLSAPLPRQPAGAVPLGCWYILDESSGVEAGPLFFVFVIMRNGILVPFGAQIGAEGIVTEIIPLASHARKVMDRIPQGLFQLYTRRIESVVAREMRER